MATRWIGIVDAYSTGATLAQIFKDKGWGVVHIHSHAEPPTLLASSYRPDTFDLPPLYWDPSDSEKVLLPLKQLQVEAVVAGSEPGVLLADELAYRLGLPCNDQSKREARRNKDSMARALATAGLATARFTVAADHESAINAAKDLGNWPVVVKPINAAGSEDVYICSTLADVSLAFSAIYQKKNMMGIPNSRVMVQEYLTGIQYMCNAVSIGGRHRITEIWQVERRIIPRVGVLHDREVIVPFQGDDQKAIIHYVNEALTAVGIAEGASNTELMLTTRGPVLIETSARTQGGIHSPAVIDALGQSHATSTYLRYTYPDVFKAGLSDGYQIRKNTMVVHLISEQAGKVVDNSGLDRLKSLNSFNSIKGIPALGVHIKRTANLVTSTGRVYLIHDDPAQLMRDYLTIREWENDGLLISVSPAGASSRQGEYGCHSFSSARIAALR